MRTDIHITRIDIGKHTPCGNSGTPLLSLVNPNLQT
jgi:hypothetical protein